LFRSRQHGDAFPVGRLGHDDASRLPLEEGLAQETGIAERMEVELMARHQLVARMQQCVATLQRGYMGVARHEEFHDPLPSFAPNSASSSSSHLASTDSIAGAPTGWRPCARPTCRGCDSKKWRMTCATPCACTVRMSVL